MTDEEAADLEQRVLVLAPSAKDAALTRSVLGRAGVRCEGCPDLEALCEQLEAGVGAVLLAEEALGDRSAGCLAKWLGSQPHWSDLPILLLARPGADSAAVAEAMDLLGKVTVLERPLRLATLVSAVRAALRGRRRQYETRAHLLQIEQGEHDLREADRRKDEFLAVLAHELRNPLAPIRHALHVLQMTRESDPSADRMLDMMQRQVDHIVRLVDDLLEVSRISRGKIELRMEPVEVASVVRSALEASGPLIEASRHQLSLAIPSEPLTVVGDAVRLSQVIANLLNNAAKYTEPGGRIWCEVRRDGDQVNISIRDTGAGIPPERLPQVFDMFMQIERSGGAQGGLGIGLALVKSLVEMHGGSVRAHSDGPGRGSEFVVRLPLT